MSIFRDLRYAFRALRGSPSFSLICIGTLALGIGVATAIFAVVNGVLLRPLPFPDPERIVSVNTRFLSEGRQIPRVAGGDWEDLRHHSAFEAVASYMGGELGVQLGERAEFQRVFLVTPQFFQVFALAPRAGRLFTAGDAGVSALVSERFASHTFGGVEAALEKRFAVEGKTYEIVGVMPAGFHFPQQADLWLASDEKATNRSRTAYNYRPIARLAENAPLSVAEQQMDAFGKQLAAQYANTNSDKTFTLVPLREQLTGDSRWTLLLLFAAVGLLLLIACVNVANLFLARATSRIREVSIRGALGASRWTVVRQFLVESSLIAIAAGIAGVGIASWATSTLLRFVPAGIQRIDEVHLDPWVLLFALAASTLAVLMFGVLPAWQAAKIDPREGLASGGNRGVLGGRLGWIRGSLVVAEVAMAVVLALGAGLLFRTMMALNESDIGVDSTNLLVMYTHEPAGSEDDYRRVARGMGELGREIEALPGVQSAAAIMGLPTGAYGSHGAYAIEGKNTFGEGVKLPQAQFAVASPGYFATAGIPLLRGREFSATDLYENHFVAIVSESLVRDSFGDEDPIGKQIVCGLDSPKPMTIVGVVRDVRKASPSSPPDAHLYMPMAQHPYYANEVQVLVRSHVAPASMIPVLERFMRQRNAGISTKFTTMEQMISESVALPRFRSFLCGIFALISLALAAAGIYGVMAFAARQRTGEVGLRAALGAAPTGIWALFLKQSAKLAGAGLAVGVALSLATGRLLEGMLFGVEAVDFLTYVGVVAGVAFLILLAAAGPAYRAATVDPLVALREE